MGQQLKELELVFTAMTPWKQDLEILVEPENTGSHLSAVKECLCMEGFFAARDEDSNSISTLASLAVLRSGEIARPHCSVCNDKSKWSAGQSCPNYLNDRMNIADDW